MTEYGVRLTVGGSPVPTSWTGGRTAALDGLSIDWGRDSPYDDQNPAVCRLDILTPDAGWFDRRTVGDDVQVWRTGGDSDRRVFWGVTTDMQPERVYVTSPVTGKPVPVWIVHLTAQDKLGQAGGVVVAGPMGSDSYEGLGGWGEAVPRTRMSQMANQGALDLFTGGWTLGEPSEPNYQDHEYWWGLPTDDSVVINIHGIKGSDAPSAAELLHGVMHTRAAAAIQYDAHRDRVGPVASYVQGGGITWTREGTVAGAPGTLGLAPLHASLLGWLSARLVGTPDGYTLQQTVTDAIDSATVTGYYYGKETLTSSGGIEYKEISMSDSLGAQGVSSRNLTSDMRGMQYDPSLFTAGSVDDNNRGMPWVLDQLLAIARRLNGWMAYPTLELDQRRLPLPDDVAVEVFDTMQPARAWYLAASVFAEVSTVPQEVQMIGGTLTYQDGGWIQRPNLMPAVDGDAGSGPGLNWGQLFNGSPSTAWQSFDETVSWADLSYVSKGITS